MTKTVLITGASRGIGEAVARLFASRGYAVAVNFRESAERAAGVAKDIVSAGGTAEIFRADISNSSQATDLIERVTACFGRIDVLINNAGVAWQGLFQLMADDEYDRLMDTNVRGTFNCTRAVLPQMISRKSGSIVNLSSVLGVSGGSCEVIYSASKAALIGMTKALAKEVGPSGIRVNCIAPGVIDTDMNACHDGDTLMSLSEDTALGCIGSPQQVAQAALFLASDEASFITGQVLGVDGGLVI